MIKLVVWDLDNTVWQGVLLEGAGVNLKQDVHQTIKTLDSRGILHSIASKNHAGQAMAKLKEVGIHEYFLYPQISWRAKSASIQVIAESINIGLDSVAFIDDEPYEREEVRASLPEVMVLEAEHAASLADRPEFTPALLTEESIKRRQIYRASISRKNAQKTYAGPNENFFSTLELELTISGLHEGDLQRAEELTIRTHQMNTTGHVYSAEELRALRQSSNHVFLMAALRDRFGYYGKVGLMLIEKAATMWTLQLFLVSCRVMSLGVGSNMLNHLLGLAREAGVGVQAEFLANQRNRMMLIPFKLAGFLEHKRSGNFILLRYDLQRSSRAKWLRYTRSEWLTFERHPEWIRVNVIE